MKKIYLSILFSGLTLLAILLVYLSLHKPYLDSESMEILFKDNRLNFENAAAAIRETPCEHLVGIIGEGQGEKLKRIQEDGQFVVVQVQELYFYADGSDVSVESYESYLRLYDVVKPLLSQAGMVHSIFYNESMIHFSLKYDTGFESAIVFSYSGKDPAYYFADILEEKSLGDDWYSVAVCY